MSESHVKFRGYDRVDAGYWLLQDVPTPINQLGIQNLRRALRVVNRSLGENRKRHAKAVKGITHAKEKILIDEDYMHALESVKAKRDELLTELKSRK